jgi:hypothetical protein
MTDRYDDDNDERTSGAVLTALASSGLAVVAVLVLVGVLFLVFGDRADIAGVTAKPDGPADPGLIPRPADSGSASPTASAPGNGTTPTPSDVAVVVLNATDRKGLAARFADQLKAAGWKVAAVGNFRGNVPATTVYYPSGEQEAAQALDAQFAGVDRVRPAFSGISQTRLTVILTSEFPAP